MTKHQFTWILSFISRWFNQYYVIYCNIMIMKNGILRSFLIHTYFFISKSLTLYITLILLIKKSLINLQGCKSTFVSCELLHPLLILSCWDVELFMLRKKEHFCPETAFSALFLKFCYLTFFIKYFHFYLLPFLPFF